MSKRNPKSFYEVLDMNTCRFIAGDPSDDTAIYCGADKVRGKSYCAAHSKKCLKKPKKYN